ncbi:MAG TPA: hypothetical protein VJI66_03025 [Candidatus Paceibacterota bacterium]
MASNAEFKLNQYVRFDGKRFPINRLVGKDRLELRIHSHSRRIVHVDDVTTEINGDPTYIMFNDRGRTPSMRKAGVDNRIGRRRSI